MYHINGPYCVHEGWSENPHGYLFLYAEYDTWGEPA